jgi:hypothetical protein
MNRVETLANQCDKASFSGSKNIEREEDQTVVEAKRPEVLSWNFTNFIH